MLNRTGVQGAGLKILADARVPLRELDLGRSRLSVGALELLEGFRALEVLHLDGMLVDGERLAALRHLPLHTLTVSTTAVVVADLRELKRLRRLDLSGTDLDDSGARHLAALDRLAVLGVRDTAFGDDGLLELTRRLPSLRRVYAGQNQFSEAAIARARAINPRLAVDRTGQALDLHLDDPEPTDRSPHSPVR